MFALVGANEGQEKGGRAASGAVSGSRSADETQILPEWSGADKNPSPLPQHAGSALLHLSIFLHTDTASPSVAFTFV